MGRLAVTYFHTGICTIIGAVPFHCPVRNGKEWDQNAMAAKHKLTQQATLVTKTEEVHRILLVQTN